MKTITTGTENFKEFIDKNYYYVDKSNFIENIFLDKVSLFTRPRRFGKTLNMSMLYYFFSNKEKNNAYLFNNLNIKNNKEIMKHRNQYPVIFITLKDMKSNSFDSQLYMFGSVIAMALDKFEDILNSEKFNEREKELLKKYHNNKATENELRNALLNISICLEKYYGQKVIILIDEYDVPLQSAYSHGHYDEMTNFISQVFSSSLKTNDSLERGILTGCLRIAKESIFTGLNNFSVYSIFDEIACQDYGFTQQEVDELLSYYCLNQYREEIKEWYDGYLFGNTEIYNPWSTLQYIKKLLHSTSKMAESFWANTSGNDIVYNYIKQGNQSMKDDFERLVQNKTITKTIKPELTYREMEDIENIYSFLLFTGYLKVKKQLSINEYDLIIPNNEVRLIYEQSFQQYFKEYTRDRKNMFVEKLLSKEEKEAQKIMNNVLKNTISYYDNYESFYHGFMIGFLKVDNYDVKSNRESGEGRFDILIIPDEIDETAIIIECKHVKNKGCLKKESQKAAKQITEKGYVEELQNDGYENMIAYGISFYQKQCYITKV